MVVAVQTNSFRKLCSYLGNVGIVLFKVSTAIMKFSWYLHKHTLCGNWLLSKTCRGLSSANLLLPIFSSGYISRNIAIYSGGQMASLNFAFSSIFILNDNNIFPARYLPTNIVSLVKRLYGVFYLFAYCN